MKRYLVVLIWLMAAPVRAGDVAGNGGDGVICEKSGVQGIALLDFFEHEQTPVPLVPDLGPSDLGVRQKLGIALQRLAVFDRPRAERYLARLDTFYQETVFVTGPLEDIPDSGEISLPAGCSIVQLAIQRRPLHPGDKRYLIDKTFWGRLSFQSQAGLILHEIVYGETLSLGHNNSILARYFTALIASAALESWTQTEYDDAAERVFKPVHGVKFKQTVFNFDVKVGQPMVIPLLQLLEHTGTGKLEWFADQAKPSWLRLEKEKLTGFPMDLEPVAFRLAVQSGDFGGIALINLTVVGQP